MENEALVKMEIKIRGIICDEEAESNIRIYFWKDYVSRNYVSRNIENVIENIKKLFKKYDKINKIYVWISEDSCITLSGQKTVNGVEYDFIEFIKSIHDKNINSFVEFKGYAESESKKIKNDVINDILNLYNEAQKIYIQKLQQRLKEVV